jgi:MFS transporter, NNP family, nitrate/nitrite transporter
VTISTEEQFFMSQPDAADITARTPESFLSSGHLPTLIACLLYFDVSFMVWVLLGPLAPFLSEDLRLTAAQKGLMVALPLLGGALFRPIMGVLGDLLGGRRAGMLGLALTLLPLFLGWRFARHLHDFYAIGILLGIAGASFAVALPLAGSWYPPERQGLAMGIAGAGNSGTLLATLFAPRLAQAFGWPNTFAVAMLPVFAVLVLFGLMAKNNPLQAAGKSSWRDYAAVIREPDTGWFCFFYSFTFGGFVGLASFLSIFFHDQYLLPKVKAGDFTTIVVVAGSFLRPVGGWLADKVGGYRLLLMLLSGAACCLAGVGTLPSLPVVVILLFLTMAMLGMGNGAVFQLVPQRFSHRVGVLTGLVGAAGGLGGFFLPSILGAVKDRMGQYGMGFFLFAGAFLVAAFVLLQLGSVWRTTWSLLSVERAGIFCYRSFARTLASSEN